MKMSTETYENLRVAMLACAEHIGFNHISQAIERARISGEYDAKCLQYWLFRCAWAQLRTEDDDSLKDQWPRIHPYNRQTDNELRQLNDSHRQTAIRRIWQNDIEPRLR